jgi:hypothetical protein
MMKKTVLIAMLGLFQMSTSAKTNALIEVKLFKDWLIKGELGFANLAIKNTGTEPIILAKDPFNFEIGQFTTRPLPPKEYEDSKQEGAYQMMMAEKPEFTNLHPEETHVYEGRKFYLEETNFFSEKMRFTISIYLRKGFWLDSEPMMLKGVVPDSVDVAATMDYDPKSQLVLVTHKNERWLYLKSIGLDYYYSVCPLSLTNKIRVEPHDGARQFKIWDGDKFMILDTKKIMLLEGPDENDVFGKWTRERKQRAEADNAEVRRKKAEQ